jgi:predicted RNase H-like HicB family nuclease
MTAKYHINLFWSELDGAWVADVPDLQSCSAFGDSPAQALAEVEKAWRLGSRSRARTGCRSRNPAITWQNAPPRVEHRHRAGTARNPRLRCSPDLRRAGRERHRVAQKPTLTGPPPTAAPEPFRPPASALGMALSAPERTISVCRRGTVGLHLAAAPRSLYVFVGVIVMRWTSIF